MTIALLLLAGILLVVAGWYFRTGTIPTPIPKSLVRMVRQAHKGSWLLTVWRAFLVLLVFLAAIVVVGIGGPVAGVIAFLLISALISDAVRDVVSDLWNANFVTLE